MEKDRKEWFQAIWNKEFKDYKITDVSILETESCKQNVLHVTVLTGDTAEINFNESWTILKLMMEIKKAMNIDINEQKLLYFGKELSVITKSNFRSLS